MRLIVLTATACLALAGCSKPTETVSAEANAAAPAATPAADAPPTMTAAAIAGIYDAKYPDGRTHVVEIRPDGTYTDTDADGAATKGQWSWQNGKSCFDPDGEAAAVCWTDGKPDANGVFTATRPDGTVVTVSPQAKPAVTG